MMMTAEFTGITLFDENGEEEGDQVSGEGEEISPATKEKVKLIIHSFIFLPH